MVKLENMTEYQKWIDAERNSFRKETVKIVYIRSIEKCLCICGTPVAVEPIFERTGHSLIKEWNECLKLNNESGLELDTEDTDLISEMRDAAMKVLVEHLDIEFVYLSTEY